MGDTLKTLPEKTIVKFVQNDLDFKGCLRLRYNVFVEELGAKTSPANRKERLERDEFDAFCQHIALIDTSIEPETLDHVIGIYRFFTEQNIQRAGRFYSETEFDISNLKKSGRSLLEFGRSCVKYGYRNQNAMRRIWLTLANFVQKNNIGLIFGTVSFHGTDIEPIRPALAYLHHHHLAPPALRTKAIGKNAVSHNAYALTKFDIKTIASTLPPMLKAYLKLGGFVGDGVWIDKDFNTTDVLIAVDIETIPQQQKVLYADKNS